MRWVLTLATAVLCATPIIGNANTWYIDNAVPSPGNGSSWSFAWKRFADISWDVIRAGDTICISGGLTSQTYNETLSVGASGSSAGPITITKGFDAGHSGIVIIDGENRLPNGVYIDGHDNVTVENLSIRNIADAGISIEYAASGVNIQNNSVYLESVRKVYEGLHSFRSISRIDARRMNATALRVRFSKSLARRRQRLSQAKVRSTIQRRGRTSNPTA